MQEQQLFRKYNSGQHWKKHPTTYSKSFADFLKKQKFKGLLVDLGCGSGRDVNVFDGYGFKVVGIDNSTEQIKSDKKQFPKLCFEVQDAEKLEFEDGSVDAFFMINVIHYVNKEKAIKEIFRTLKPKGFLFIHFNTDIIDKNGNVDYHHESKAILKLMSKFRILHQRVFERIDTIPVEHKHRVLELIVEKP